jgi:tetratricopeptide (TPR) repeat protein
MSPEQVQWMPALLALAAGAAGGIFFLFRSRDARRARPAEVEAVVTLRDLEEERESIVSQLRELDEIAPGAAADRLELELQGARVLREIDRFRAGAASRRPEPRATRDTAPQVSAPDAAPGNPWVGFAGGFAAVIAVALIGVFVSRSTTPKDVSAMAPAPAASTAAPSPELAQLEAAVNANPDNVEMRLALARQFLMAERLMEVYAHTEYILQRDADNAAALTYQSIVRTAMGEHENALLMVQRALVNDPDFIDAYVQLAMIHSTAGRRADAEAAMREAIARHPDEKQALESILAQIQAQPGA